MQENCVINVENSINSGQVFLWKKNGDYWVGVNGQDVLRIDKNGIIESYQNLKTDFFRKNDDLDEIIKSISKDKTVRKAVKKYVGLRILKQDPFQCLISFIVSSNSNIQKIKTNLENISRKFGTKIEFENQEFFLFPDPERLGKASINEITSCGVGYRAKFIKEAANMIFSKEIDFESLKKSNYFETKKSICSIPGVGNKVADCIMLFSLNKLEAFPLDRWMIRILEKYYSNEFYSETKTITEKQYNILHEKIVNHFGPYAGYAQQFLFKMEREKYQKKWL
ncbi:MAG: DNA repair protein [Thaumarchaeota archaeon]|nr:DNA repair protein [Nitrososphaerota archaeon]